MENIAKVRLLATIRTGRTSDVTLFGAGEVISSPFPRAIVREFGLRPHLFEIIEYKREPEKPIAASVQPEKPKKSEKPKLKYGET